MFGGKPRKARGARWCQFGLRGMFLATAACAIWLGVNTKRAREQTEAVHAILEWGGEVEYDFQDGSEERVRLQPPAWLRRSLGDDILCNVTYVHLEPLTDLRLTEVAKMKGLRDIGSLDASRLTDAGVTHLAGLTALRGVYFARSQLSDESFRVFGKLRQLTGLDVPGARISDAGIVCLRDNSHLRSLLVGDDDPVGRNAAGVTDFGMRALAGLVELEELDLRGTRVTSNGLFHLRPLAKLRVLNLSYSADVTDEGLRHLAHSHNLEELRLNNTSVSSEGLRHLTGLTKLRILDLAGNRGVTDDGISRLSGLVQLEELYLRGTEITSCAAVSLTGLSKLRYLDISENRQINDHVLAPLANLPALQHLDLHNTRVRIYGRYARANRNHLRHFPQLRVLHLSGTGAEVGWLSTFLPRRVLIGSRVTHVEIARPRWEGAVHCDDIVYEHDRRRLMADSARARLGHAATLAHILEGQAAAGGEGNCSVRRRRGPSDDSLDWKLREKLIDCTLSRMLALSTLPSLGAVFAEERSIIEMFLAKFDAESCSDKTAHRTLFREFLIAARSDMRLARLYATATDLQFADVLRSHIDCLEQTQRNWLLTDVERAEYEQLPWHLHYCLDDASSQLGLAAQASLVGKPSEDVIEIWGQTRPRSTNRPYDREKRAN